MSVAEELLGKSRELVILDEKISRLQRERNEILEEIAVLAIDATKPSSVIAEVESVVKEFQVGDRVRCLTVIDFTDNKSVLPELQVGDVGTVLSPYVYGEREIYRVDWDRINNRWGHTAEQLELV